MKKPVTVLEADGEYVTYLVSETARAKFRRAALRLGGFVVASAPSGVMGPSYTMTVRFAAS